MIAEVSPCYFLETAKVKRFCHIILFIAAFGAPPALSQIENTRAYKFSYYAGRYISLGLVLQNLKATHCPMLKVDELSFDRSLDSVSGFLKPADATDFRQ